MILTLPFKAFPWVVSGKPWAKFSRGPRATVPTHCSSDMVSEGTAMLSEGLFVDWTYPGWEACYCGILLGHCPPENCGLSWPPTPLAFSSGKWGTLEVDKASKSDPVILQIKRWTFRGEKRVESWDAKQARRPPGPTHGLTLPTPLLSVLDWAWPHPPPKSTSTRNVKSLMGPDLEKESLLMYLR